MSEAEREKRGRMTRGDIHLLSSPLPSPRTMLHFQELNICIFCVKNTNKSSRSINLKCRNLSIISVFGKLLAEDPSAKLQNVKIFRGRCKIKKKLK